MDLPLLPIIAIVAGLLILIRKELLPWAVAMFLIGFGALGVARFYGLPVAEIEAQLNQAMDALL